MSTEAVERKVVAAACSCTHCGLPVPAGLVEDEADEQFCCGACRIAYGAINACGLGRYYALRDAAGVDAERAKGTGRKYAEFDDDAFAALYVKDRADGLCTAELFIEGMHCIACVWLLEKLPELCPGAVECRVELGRSMVRVVWDRDAVSLSDVATWIDRLGYVPHPARDGAARKARREADRRALVRIGVAGAIAGNTMLLAIAVYTERFNGMEPEFKFLFRACGMALAVLSISWPGRVFFKGALAAIRTRTGHLDLPIAIALGIGAVAGTVNVVLGIGEVYFDALTMLVFLLLLGRWVQRRRQEAATDSIELLYSITPMRARLVVGDDTREVAVESLDAGAVVEVLAGESVPADGVVVRGRSSVDVSVLTGESRPVDVGTGDEVCAGSVNMSGVLRVRVEATGAETRVGRLMSMVEESARRRAPIVTAADKIAGWFVWVVGSIALATFAVWLVIDAGHAVEPVVALLIVTCPCALGLATPMAVTAAVGRAARQGILIKGGDVLERLNKPGVVLLDKTGTLTEGRFGLVRWVGDEGVGPMVGALERQVAHPIAVALRELAEGDDLVASDVESRVGRGVVGGVAERRVAVGSERFVASVATSGAERFAGVVREARESGLTAVLASVDGRVSGVAVLGDPLRSDAKDAVSRLKGMGYRVRIVSGDDPSVAERVGGALGLASEDCLGGKSPEQKLAIVEEHLEDAAMRSRPVVMVGDGVNDAAALARATVGVAVHGGAEASLSAADVYLQRPGVGPVVELVEGSRRALRVIRRNLAFSLGYNVLTGSLAVLGLMTALLAAVLMPISSLTVLTMSYRSRTFGKSSEGARR